MRSDDGEDNQKKDSEERSDGTDNRTEEDEGQDGDHATVKDAKSRLVPVVEGAASGQRVDWSDALKRKKEKKGGERRGVRGLVVAVAQERETLTRTHERPVWVGDGVVDESIRRGGMSEHSDHLIKAFDVCLCV